MTQKQRTIIAPSSPGQPHNVPNIGFSVLHRREHGCPQPQLLRLGNQVRHRPVRPKVETLYMRLRLCVCVRIKPKRSHASSFVDTRRFVSLSHLPGHERLCPLVPASEVPVDGRQQLPSESRRGINLMDGWLMLSTKAGLPRTYLVCDLCRVERLGAEDEVKVRPFVLLILNLPTSRPRPVSHTRNQVSFSIDLHS